MKRILCIFALILAFLLFSVPCFADTNAGNIEEIVAPDAGDVNAEGAEEAKEPEVSGAPEENLFAVLYEALASHAADLFSALAAAASLLIVFSYKKGFLPLAAGALEKLSGKVCDLGNEAQRGADAVGELSERLLPKFCEAEEMLRSYADRLKEYEAKLPSVEETEGERALLFRVLSEQIDLLSDIFLASSLPEYRKAAVGERVASMKAMITAGSTTGIPTGGVANETDGKDA